MPRFKLNKLVRDRIVEHQLKAGEKPRYRQLSKIEHREALINKIIEEIKELVDASAEDVAAEIADVQQALDDLIEQFNVDPKTVRIHQARKTKENGAFKKGIYVEYVDLDEKDPFTKYYRKDPERFPELND